MKFKTCVLTLQLTKFVCVCDYGVGWGGGGRGGRYIEITLTVRLSVRPYVCAKFVSSPYLSYRDIFYFTQGLHMTLKFAMILTQSHSGNVRVAGKKSANFVSGLCLSSKETVEVPTSRKYCLWSEGVS